MMKVSTPLSRKEILNFRPSRLVLAIALATFTMSSVAANVTKDPIDLHELLAQKDQDPNGIIEKVDKNFIGEPEVKDSNFEQKFLYNFDKPGRNDIFSQKVQGELNLTINHLDRKTGSTALYFFEKDWMSTDTNNPGPGYHEYIFEDKLTLRVKEATVNVLDMIADGGDNPGLFLSNKKKGLKFKEPVYFEINYNGVAAPDQKPMPAIFAGIYTTFGAAQLTAFDDDLSMFGQTLDKNRFDVNKWKYGSDGSEPSIAWKKGRTYFNAGLDLRLINGIRVEEEDLYASAYGIYLNEGGGVYIDQKANLITITSDQADHVSALHLSSAAGILDPFKQGEIKIDNLLNTSRIWALSSNQPIILPTDSPESVKKRSFTVRNAVESLHGSEVSISDSRSGAGWLDIRGNIVAGALNGQKDLDPPSNSHVAYMKGKANHATVDINLSNKNSKLFGNVYEYHRLSEDEVAEFKIPDEHNSSTQVFEGWLGYIAEKESQSLGGTVNLSLSNGATWFPLSRWYGWDMSVATTPVGDLDKLNDPNSSVGVNRLDQYNLYTYKEGKKVELNPLDEEHKKAINDSDLEISSQNNQTLGYEVKYVDRNLTNAIPSDQRQEVNNGIYRLNLDGGFVDTRFMRMDFGEVIGVKDTDELFHDAMVEITQNKETIDEGIKTLRIQKLKGSGQFNLYIKDQANHDLLIVDQTSDSKENQITFWNLVEKDDPQYGSLGIVAGNESTYIQVARAAKEMAFKPTVEFKMKDSAFQWVYTLVRDDDLSISMAQDGTLMHELTDNWFLTSSKKEENPNVTIGTFNAYNVPYLFATKVERMQKRMGEVRHALGKDHGLWVRYNHTHDELEDFDARASMIEIGADVKRIYDSGVMLHGLAISYLDSEADYSQISNSTADTKRYRASLYNTWLGDSGAYVDLVGRIGRYKSDFSMNLTNERELLTGDLALWAASASIESGHKFNSAQNWFIEPQVQVQYTHLVSSHYDSSHGIHVDNSEVDSVIGRVGIRLGKDAYDEKTQGEKAISYYIRGDLYHEFMGDRDFTMRGSADKVALEKTYDGKRTWYGVGLGITGKFNNNAYIYFDAERQYGSGLVRIWELNVGMRYHF